MKRFILLLYLLFQCSFLIANPDESVVCVHGFMRCYRCMIPMGNMLRDHGYNVYLWDYPSRKETIEGHAGNLCEVLKMIAKKNPGKPIHFVTHSLGGVVVRAAVNHPECPPEAKMGKAILLAPPNQGSCLARKFKNVGPIQWLFGKKSGRQLLDYDPGEMTQLGTFPDTMDVMVLAGSKGSHFWFKTPNDGKVTVEETRLTTPHTHHTLFVGHSWIMTSRYSLHITKEFLSSDEDP